MASSLGDQEASSPARAVSLEPPRCRSDSMEDADSSLRKRPRLDPDLDRSLRSLSADPPSAALSVGPSQNSVWRSTGNTETPTMAPNDRDGDRSEKPTLNRSSSKMTINTKSPTIPVPSPGIDDSLSTSSGAQGDTQAMDEDAQNSARTPSTDTAAPGSAEEAAISVSSSPNQSPEIEAAEIEDMDQDPAETVWPSSVPSVDLVVSFSSWTNVRDPIKALVQFRGMLQSYEHDGQAVYNLARWLKSCTEGGMRALKQSLSGPDRDFWKEFPIKVMEDILDRSTFFSDGFNVYLRDGQNLQTTFQHLLVNYAILVINIADVERLILEKLPDNSQETPDPIASLYLDQLESILGCADPASINNCLPLHRLLARGYNMDNTPLMNEIVSGICAPSSQCLYRLNRLGREILRVSPKPNKALTQYLARICGIMSNVLRYTPDDHTDLSNRASIVRRTQSVFDFVQFIDPYHEEFISKLHPHLTAEVNKCFINSIADCLLFVASFNPKLVVHVSDRYAISESELDHMEWPKILKHAWTFHRLLRCITKGRMELRALAVDMMSEKLVNVYHDYIRENPATAMSNHVVRYLVSFIREVKVIDYIVGVDSHTQLMRRGANIIGFLSVTHQYNDTDTDQLWRVIMESEDPRAIDAIVNMLNNTVRNFQELEPILYLCSKLLDVPMRRFERPFIEFTQNLLETIANKCPTTTVPLITFQVAIRLLRDSTSCVDLAADRKKALLDMAQRHILHKELSREDALGIYESCIQDVKEKNSQASSALKVVNLLLRKCEEDITLLASTFDFTRLYIEELANAIASSSSGFADLQKNAFEDRLLVFDRIVSHIPETLTEELGQTLWDSLFASNNLATSAREEAWRRLSHITRAHYSGSTRNSFLDRCMDEFLSNLPTHFLDASVLDFAVESIKYDTRLDPPPPAAEGEIVTIPSVRRLWDLLNDAPPGTIETRVSNALVDLYLDDPLIRMAPRSAAEATHVSLVDECVKRLTESASKLKGYSDGTTSGEDEPMIIVAPESEIKAVELGFSRSLLFLKDFLQGLRKRPHYSIPVTQERQNKGNMLELLYEWFDVNGKVVRRNLRIGDLETFKELKYRLVEITGFTNVQVFCGKLGRIDFAKLATVPLRNEEIWNAGHLLVRVPDNGGASPPSRRRQSLHLVDCEVLKHFDSLYDLLDLDDKFSRQVHEFLSVFPPQPRVKELIHNMDSSDIEIFPPDKPFKILFSIFAMNYELVEQGDKPQADEPFLLHCVQVLAGFLTRSEAADSIVKSRDSLITALRTVSSLQSALRILVSTPRILEPVSKTRNLISEPSIFAERLSEYIIEGLEQTTVEWTEDDAAIFVSDCFSCLVHSSILHNGVWEVFEKQFLTKLLSLLLLTEERSMVRKTVGQSITQVCHICLHPKDDMDSIDIVESTAIVLGSLWSGVASILPNTTGRPTNSDALFAVASSLLQILTQEKFQVLAEGTDREINLQGYVLQWSQALLSYRPFQFVGKDLRDSVVSGFIKLMLHAVKVCISRKEKLDLQDFREDAFITFLFPQLSRETNARRITPSTPIMDRDTRAEIYDLILALCNDRASYWKTLGLLEELIPKDTSYERTMEEVRIKGLRTEMGYAGLRNLSNTCYVNSLLAQLFMNISFRDFIVHIRITDPSGQRLLAELQRVFSYMQDSWLKYADTQDLAESIQNYDLEPLDIHNQMDVSEFYALLFHRLESQIPSPDDQGEFRSFYGGQVIQQIKSKECTHVSERTETFNTIQCDIKGKTCLEESLKAYVEGEVMQGDNKYSCTSCGRHVDAVKRSCLKEIPDHLIFQIKRFDFDLATMLRFKVNDEFHFPSSIDMAPFKFETLNGDGEDAAPDIFELVGVLVHTGSAEGGHYYSFIKQRPVASNTYQQWVEFNDDIVQRFDPSYLADHCFGGMSQPRGHGEPYVKLHNAYMLFYQRVSDIEACRQYYKPDGDMPVTAGLSTQLGNNIALNNELAVRGSLLLEPDHARFTDFLLAKMRWGANLTCSNEHRIEQKAIHHVLNLTEQIIVKADGTPEFEMLIDRLEGIVKTCVKCATLVLDWNAKNPDWVRNILLKNKNPAIREKFSSLFIIALKCVKNTKCLVRSESGTQDLEDREGVYFQQFRSFVYSVRSVCYLLPTHTSHWDDYFRLVRKLAGLGMEELAILLDEGFFDRCLELLLLDDITKRGKLKLLFHGQQYQRLAERRRKLQYNGIIDLIAHFLDHVNLTAGFCYDSAARGLASDGKLLLRAMEGNLLRTVGADDQLVLVDRIASVQWNMQAPLRILKTLVLAEPVFGEHHRIVNAITQGMKVDPAVDAVLYLEMAIVFCETSHDAGMIKKLITEATQSIDSIGQSGGVEHVNFVKRLAYDIKNRRCPEARPEWFKHQMRLTCPEWAPTLLTYPDRVVRSLSENLVFQLVLDTEATEDNETEQQVCQHVGRALAKSCNDKIQILWVKSGQTPFAAALIEVNNILLTCARFFDQTDDQDAMILNEIQDTMNAARDSSIDMAEDIEIPTHEWDTEDDMSDSGFSTTRTISP